MGEEVGYYLDDPHLQKEVLFLSFFLVNTVKGKRITDKQIEKRKREKMRIIMIKPKRTMSSCPFSH